MSIPRLRTAMSSSIACPKQSCTFASKARSSPNWCSLWPSSVVPTRFATVDEIRKAYDFSKLRDFLDIYHQGMGVLQTEQDFYVLT